MQTDEQPQSDGKPADVAESWTGRVLPMEKGAATVSAAQRNPVTKLGDGMVLQISLGEAVKVIGLLLIAASIYFGIKYDLRDIKQAQEWQSGQLKELSGKWQLQQMDIYDIKIALAAAGIWKGPVTVTNIPSQAAPGTTVTVVPQQPDNKQQPRN